MKLVALPSGIILNLEHVAFVTPSRKVEGALRVAFNVALNSSRGASVVDLILKDDDKLHFIAALKRENVSVNWLEKALAEPADGDVEADE